MPFTQQNVNYAEEYSQALMEAYPYLSYFAAIWAGENSTRYMPGVGATMYIPSISVSGARFTNRDSINGQFSRNWNNEWQAVNLQMDRDWDTLVDPMQIQETDMVASIGNITKVFVETQKVPEMDAFMSSKLAEFAANYGGVSTASLSASTILDEWDNALVYMTNNRVNRDRVICYVIPAVYKLLKQATGMTRFIEVTNGERNVDRNIARLDGVTIIEVPADMMKTAYDFTEGWAVASGAAQVNFILVDPLAVAAPIKYETSMVSAPTAATRGKYIYYERYYYGAFILNKRQAGVFMNVGTAPTLGSLSVTSVAGTGAAGDTIVSVTGNEIGGNGDPMYGLKLMYSVNNAAVSLTYGSAPDTSKTWAELTNGGVLAGQTAGKYITVALVNASTGGVIAGGNTTLVVKT